jgi:hypothetical protein
MCWGPRDPVRASHGQHGVAKAGQHQLLNSQKGKRVEDGAVHARRISYPPPASKPRACMGRFPAPRGPWLRVFFPCGPKTDVAVVGGGA